MFVASEVLIQFTFALLAALTIYLFPQNFNKTKIFSLVAAIINVGLCILLVQHAWEQNALTELLVLNSFKLELFFGLTYTLAIDGLSAVLILLNSVLLFLVIITTWDFESHKFRLYYFSLFFLTWAVNGALLSFNLYSFYIFWEAMLIPLFILIGVFGGAERKFASYKFFLYTAAGSFIMLGAIIYLSSLSYEIKGTYDLTPISIQALHLPFDGIFSAQSLVFLAFSLAMLIKIPAFPFHSWLPLAHVQAPTAGSIILAGILLKLGIYGLLRFVIPVYPEATEFFRYFMMSLGAVGVIYGALTALVQTDVKKVVAYSSISHMGFMLAGIFSASKIALSGSIFQLISHGITTGGLFIVVHYLYIRRHTKEISAFGGIAKKMPVFSVAFFIILMGSMAVPLTSGFVGEFLIIWGLYKVAPWIAVLCALGVILTPVYLLNLYQKMMLGPLVNVENEKLEDLSRIELLPFIILGFLILLIGVYPHALTFIYEGFLNNMSFFFI
ncbi:MAG: NADH-quinone oxidoreductase subunit M [Bacteriovoracaceae bacterium]|nr:NADH-quinone oxidoreductase subunit M [Bacteriovoracaceae bacterium]